MTVRTKYIAITIAIFAGINLFIFGLGFGLGILYPLTYTAVPLAAQHLWYGDTLQHYLWWTHLLSFIITMLVVIGINVFLVIELKVKK